MGITCHHVLKEYREWRQSCVDISFQIGNWPVDPDAFLIDESEELDLAVLDLSDAPTAELSIADAVEFFEPSTWPPSDVTAEEFVTLGGYPAQWRLQSARDVVEHAYWGLGTTMVTSVSPENVCCAFEREHWVQAYGPNMDPDDLTSLGGMSGSPAFIHRGLAWDFVGIVHQHLVSLDLLRIRPGRFIRPDGTLDKW